MVHSVNLPPKSDADDNQETEGGSEEEAVAAPTSTNQKRTVKPIQAYTSNDHTSSVKKTVKRKTQFLLHQR